MKTRTKKEFPKYLKVVLTKMCNMVGADFNKINFNQRDWYYKYTWTQEQQDKFAGWLTKLLKTNKQARTQFMKWPLMTSQIKELVDWFILDYGWKLKERDYEKESVQGQGRPEAYR